MSVCLIPTGRLFHSFGQQRWNIGLQSCCRSAWRYSSSSWQNAADDDLQTPADSQRPGKPEPCRTANGRPRLGSAPTLVTANRLNLQHSSTIHGKTPNFMNTCEQPFLASKLPSTSTALVADRIWLVYKCMEYVKYRCVYAQIILTLKQMLEV